MWAGYILFILLTCLAPFQFHPELLPRGVNDSWRFAARAALNPADSLLNVALYAPFGALGALALRRAGVPRLVVSLTLPVIGTSLAMGCECAQLMLPNRVPSFVDAAANAAGCILGMTVAPLLGLIGREVASDMRAGVVRRPVTFATQMLACALLLAFWWPFDAMLTPQQVWRTVRRAEWSPLHAWRRLPVVAAPFDDADPEFRAALVRRAQADYALGAAAEAAGYAVLAALGAFALRREYGFSRVSSGLLAAWVCLFLSALTTGGRMLLVSHGLDTFHVVSACGGAIIGIAAAAALAMRPRFNAPLLLRIAAAGSIAHLAASELSPFQFGAPMLRAIPAEYRRVNWIPFAEHVVGRPNDALRDLSTKALRYAVPAVLLLALSRRRSTARAALMAGAAAAMVCAAAQVAHRFIPARHSDVTNVLMATFGAAGGVILVRCVAEYIRAILPAVATAAAGDAATPQAGDSALEWDRRLVEAIVTSQPAAPLPDRAAPATPLAAAPTDGQPHS